jgi:sulfite reductase beta subunit-like hemoprotein
MIPRGTFSDDQWRELGHSAEEAAHGLLGAALRYEFQAHISNQRVVLERASSTLDDMRIAQGAIDAHKRDTMILDDLIRQANAAAGSRKQTGDTDA